MKHGGTIYGSNAGGSLKNTAGSDSFGHAVYAASSPAKKHNTTAGSGAALNSSVNGSSDGWESKRCLQPSSVEA
ncbi:MAG: hypothetical protein LBB61_02970 [Treponema sp.]|jgi:hypothetical protein|nr:hypothetical protein [Treponema sp.]